MVRILKKFTLLTLSLMMSLTLLGTNTTVLTAEGSNLALNKPVTYSGVEGGKKGDAWVYPQFVGEKAVDGDLASRWSADKTDYQWLQVDLKESYDINHISIHFHAEAPNYKVLISTDGETFTPVLIEEKGSQGNTKLININLEGESARYIKFEQHKMWKHSTNGKFYSSSISELSIFAQEDITLSDEGVIRVGTFNIAASNESTVKSQSLLTQQFKLDVIGLQEVDQYTKRNPYDMLGTFQSNLYQYGKFNKAMNYQDGEYGLATVSKIDLKDSSSHMFIAETGMKEPRIIQRNVIQKDGKNIAIYNMHLSYENTDVRRNQILKLIEMLEADPIEYKIAIGDFNVDQDYQEWDIIRENYQILNGMNGQWLDSYNGVDPEMKVNAVDNIVISRNLKVNEFEMVKTTLSDHHLLYAELEFLNEQKMNRDLLDFYIDNANNALENNLSSTSKEQLQVLIDKYSVASYPFDSQAKITEAAYEIKEALNNVEFSNLAHNRPVTYSGVEGGKKANGDWTYPQFVGEMAVDGKMDTRWSADKTDVQWLSVDLGAVYRIGDIHLNLHAESPQYEILVSEDGTNWTQVYEELNGSPNGDGNFVGFELSDVKARYVKYQQNKMWLHSGNGRYYSSSIIELAVYPEFGVDAITIKPNRAVVQTGTELDLQVEFEPNLASYKKLLWKSENEAIATVVDGKVTALAKGTTTITAKVTSTGETSTMTIRVVDGEIPIEEVELPEKIELYDYEGRFIDFTHYPTHGDLSQLEWIVEAETIATINKLGLVEAKATGETKIFAKYDGDILAESKVVVIPEPVSSDYHLMTKRWEERVIGPDQLDMSDPHIKSYVENIEREAEALIATLNRSSSRTDIWDRIPSDTVAANYTTQMTKIKKLALAFGIEGSVYYQDRALYEDIIDSLNFMVNDKKYNGTYSTGNWWDWQIGVPQPMVDTLFVLDKYIDLDTMMTYVKPLEGYAKRPSIQWPSYTATGANRTDIGITVLGTGILARKPARINLVVSDVPDVMKLVTRGDGIYADGGIVQHTFHAYLGSYGNELIKGVGRIFSIMDQTQWEIKDDRIENVFLSVVEGYIPLMHRGKMLSNVNGRSISRAPGTNPFTTEFEAGSETISNVMLIAQFAPQEYKKTMQSALKHWLTDSIEEYGFYDKARDFEALMGAITIMNDETIEANSGFDGMKIYSSMDRFVKETDNFKASVSGYSSRIANYEYGNTENKHGWHTGSGVLYVYNNDLSQFDEGYWPTVDPYRLPGTTIDTRPLANGAAYNVRSPQSWVGGTSDGVNGAWGMYYNTNNMNQGMNLIAQKSYFLLDDIIVNLGSNITGKSTTGIETIIDNREIKADASNAITVNGEVIKLNNEPLKLSLEADSWIHLEGNVEDSDMLYYFPEAIELSLSIDVRTGRYSDINEYFVNDVTYTKTYLKIIKEHGKEVAADDYAYVVIPGISEGQTDAYIKDLPFEIIENSDTQQSVKLGNIIASNIWPSTGGEVAGIKIDQASSVLIEESNETMTITVADPRQQTRSISLDINREIDSLESMSTKVKQVDLHNYTVEVQQTYGQSHNIVLNKVFVDVSDLEAKLEEANAHKAEDYTPTSYSALQEAIKVAQLALTSEDQQIVDDAVIALNNAIKALVPAVKTEALETKLEVAKAYKAEDYTTASYAVLQDTIEAAQLVLTSENQEEVDNAVKLLEEAIQALVLMPDITALESFLKEAKTYDATDYTKASYNALQDAIKAGQLVLESEDQLIVDQAVKALEDTIKALVVMPNTTVLEAVIEKAKEYKAEDYTKASYASLQEIIKSAERVLTSEDQNLVDDAVKSLENAIKALVPAVKTEVLEALLEEAKTYQVDDYTSASYEALQEVIKAAELALLTEDQQVVDEAVKSLEEAIIALEVIADSKLLESVLEEAKTHDAENYTDSSFASLQEAIKKAEIALTSNNQKDIDEAVMVLKEAIDNLVKADIEVPGLETPETEKPGTDKPTEGDKLPSTGVAHSYTAIVVGLGAIILGLFLAIRFKRKEYTH